MVINNNFKLIYTSVKHCQKRLHGVFKSIFLLGCLLLSAQSVLVVAGQGDPDSGQILQQIERDIEIKPRQPLPTLKEEPLPAPSDQGERVVIKTFKFEGNHVLSEESLQTALATLTNRSISVSELKTCIGIITAYYRQQGYLAIASLPDQDITEGVVLIKIDESIFGGVKFDGEYRKDFKRIKPEIIEGMIESSAPKGQVLNQDQLDHALRLVNKLSGIQVQTTLQEGSSAGTTDVLVNVKDRDFFTATLAADNTGSRQTGRNKATIYGAIASPFGLGDQLNVTGLHSQGTDYLRLAYQRPLGYRGLQIAANSSFMKYDIINPQIQNSAQASGSSDTVGLQLQYPIITSQTKNLNLTTDVEHKSFENIQGTRIENYSLNVYSAGLSGDYYDNWLSGGQTSAGLSIRAGNVGASGATVTDDAQGSYALLHWNLSRNQFLTDRLSLMINGTGQFANRNLDSSEKFYLGGLNGVRAYPTSEGHGSDGYLWIAELRQYLPHNFSVSTFVDYGHVKQYQSNSGNAGQKLTVNNAPNGYNLKGYGATAAWQGPYNANVKMTYAHRFGHNPAPASDGIHDQDGTLNYDVFWLSGSITY